MLPFNPQKSTLEAILSGGSRGSLFTRFEMGRPGRALGSDQLHSTFALEELHSLVKSMDPQEFLSWFRTIFGDDIPEGAFFQMRTAVLGGTLPQPPIDLVTGGAEGHAAGYNFNERRIVIDRGLVLSAQKSNADAWKLLVCLLEEFGHHLDNLLRTYYSKVGGDADLDEGARLAYAVVDFGWNRGRKRRQFATYITSQGRVPLEVEFSGMATAVQQFLSASEQQVDAKSENFEFFGAGRGSGKPGSYGHESIEDALERAGFKVQERIYVYFGNWLRDVSQIIDPKVTRKKGGPVWSGVSREALTGILDVMARARFGDSPAFQVTKERLGVYRNEQHVDNPSGIKNARDIDPDFRDDCFPEELEVNAALRMKNFIRNSRLGGQTARRHRVRDGDSLASLAHANGITWQELAIFNFGSADKEEITRQLYSKVGCRKRTADGRSYMFTSQDMPGIIMIPPAGGAAGSEAPYTAFNYLSGQLRDAVKAKKGKEGYRLLGHALHTLEDFFSHTNFVEIMLIHLGAWVAPWVPTRGAKAGHAENLTLTSGKFGGLDTAASLLLGVGEMLQKEQECVAGQTTTGTKIALILLKDWGYDEIHDTLGGLLRRIHKLEKEYPELATLNCQTIGVLLKAIQGSIGEIVRVLANNIDDAQTVFLQDPRSDNPTHTQLAKDHDDHLLHSLAAELAAGAVKDVGKAMMSAWDGHSTAEDVVSVAAQYIRHPTQIDPQSSAGWMLEKVRQWIPAHQQDISRLGSRTWMKDWTQRSSKHVKEMRDRAESLISSPLGSIGWPGKDLFKKEEKPATADRGFVQMQFDGKHLLITSVDTGKAVMKVAAMSGLPPQSPKLEQLIKQGRTDLKLTTDYRQPKYQDVQDAGPIPEATYTLVLTEGMKYTKSGGGWGVGAWPLKEGVMGRLNDYFGGRFGFYLHDDGNAPGTSGCIGVQSSADMEKIQNLLIKAYKQGQREVTVKVEYAD